MNSVRKHKWLYYGYKASLILLVGFMLSACENAENDDLQAYVENVKSRPAGRIEPLPDPIIYDAYLYQSDTKRDPLRPSFSGEKVAPSMSGSGIGGPDLERERTYLENFPLDGLRFIGSMKLGDESTGLVKTPDGDVVPVKVGDYIGKDFGRVISIGESEIDLRELVPDGLGGWEERFITMALEG